MAELAYSIVAVFNVVNVAFRYEAESELENKPEGSFLLRDSAQDDYIFRYSGRRLKTREMSGRNAILVSG